MKYRIDVLKNIVLLNKFKDLPFMNIKSDKSGRQFLFSPFESNFINTSMKDIGYVYLKLGHNIFYNLGKRIHIVLFYSNYKETDYVKRPGLLIKYTNGDACEGDYNKNYRSYLFITCDKRNLFPRFLKKIESYFNFK